MTRRPAASHRREAAVEVVSELVLGSCVTTMLSALLSGTCVLQAGHVLQL